METGTLMTADALMRLPETLMHQELWQGRLVETMPPGAQHGWLAVRLAGLLRSALGGEGNGIVMVETGFFLERHPDTVLAPDVSVVLAQRVPRDGPPVSFWDGVPDLAVEIRSPREAMAALNRTTRRYLAAGTLVVWLVDPAARRVTFHEPGTLPRMLAQADRLDAGQVVPELRATVEALFQV